MWVLPPPPSPLRIRGKSGWMCFTSPETSSQVVSSVGGWFQLHLHALELHCTTPNCAVTTPKHPPGRRRLGTWDQGCPCALIGSTVRPCFKAVFVADADWTNNLALPDPQTPVQSCHCLPPPISLFRLVPGVLMAGCLTIQVHVRMRFRPVSAWQTNGREWFQGMAMGGIMSWHLEHSHPHYVAHTGNLARLTGLRRLIVATSAGMSLNPCGLVGQRGRPGVYPCPIYKISPLPRGIPWNIPVENAMSKNHTVADKFEDRTRAALGIEDFLFHASAIIVAHSPSQPDTDIVSHGGRLKLALPTPSVANDTCQSIRLCLFSPAAEIFGQQFPCCVAAGNIPHRKVAVSASARQCHFKLSCPRVPYHAGP